MKMEFKEYMNILLGTQEKTKDPEYFKKLSEMSPSEKDGYMNDVFRNITELLGAQKTDSSVEDEIKSSIKYLYEQLQQENITAEIIEKKKAEIEEKSTSIEYSVGGTYFQRGIYCPSNVIDRIITNVKKGKSVKKEPTNKKDWFKYYFNGKDIIGVYFEKNRIPFFEYSQKTENNEIFYSISLENYMPDSVSAVFYDDFHKIDKYLHIDISSIDFENSLFSNLTSDNFYFEKYKYQNEVATSVNIILNGKCNSKNDNVFYDIVREFPL